MEIATQAETAADSQFFAKEVDGHDVKIFQPGVFVDRSKLLMTELCATWDYSRPERLSAIGIQIGVSPLQTWAGFEDTAPTRNFYLFEQQQDSIFVYMDDGRDCVNGWTVQEQDKPVAICLDPKENVDVLLGKQPNILVTPDGPKDAMADADAALRGLLGELCSRWDYSRPEMLGSKGVFIGVSPLQTWPGCADTAPTQSFFVFGPDVEGSPLREHTTDRRLSDEPSPAAWRLQSSATPPPANDDGARVGSEGIASPAHPGAPALAAGAGEVEERVTELTIILSRRPTRPDEPMGPRTCGALELMRGGHMVPEFTPLAGSGAAERAGAAPALPVVTQPQQQPPRPAGWGMRLSGGAAAGGSSALEVDAVVPGGPAQRSGLVRRGDVIVRVGGVDVRGWGMREVAALMASSGDELQLAVRRPERAFDF
jgi:hypothetical protein